MHLRTVLDAIFYVLRACDVSDIGRESNGSRSTSYRYSRGWIFGGMYGRISNSFGGYCPVRHVKLLQWILALDKLTLCAELSVGLRNVRIKRFELDRP